MSKPKPVHAPHPFFGHTGSELVIGGIPVSRLAAQVGQTPFYAYDRNVLTARVAELRDALPSEIHLHFAIKANPMPAVVQHMATLVDGLDVASGKEMQVALDTGIAPELISMAGPGKSPAELRQAVAAGITINIESETELDRVDAFARELGVEANIAIRVNPDFELKASGMKMAGGPKQFGIDAERVPDVLRSLSSKAVSFVGLHIFSGSQNLKAEAIIETQCKAVELAERLAQDAPTPIRSLNIGGGFGIPYFPGEPRLDIAPIGTNLEQLVDRAGKSLPEATLVLELGRYFVGEAGVYVCEVIDRKISRDHVYLITNGGLHHHLAASGNFGQVIRKNYPVLVANKLDTNPTETASGSRIISGMLAELGAEPVETASVVGPLCTPLDLLGDKVELPMAQPGDLIAVLQSGAYGPSASPQNFLSHPHVKEILVG